MKQYLIPILILLMSIGQACDVGPGGDGTPDTPSLKVESPTNITETGFQLNWTLNTQYGFNSIAVAISDDEDMDQLSKYLETENNFAQSMEVSGLQGATKYYYTISLLYNGITIFTSEIQMVETTLNIESVQFPSKQR